MPIPPSTGAQDGAADARQRAEKTFVLEQQNPSTTPAGASASSLVPPSDRTERLTAYAGTWAVESRDPARKATHDHGLTTRLETPANDMEEVLMLIGKRRAQAAGQRFEDAWRTTPSMMSMGKEGV